MHYYLETECVRCFNLELYGDVAVMNQDIFDVFREYQFSNYHFKQFTTNDVKPVYKLWRGFNTFNFSPYWVIDDDMFSVLKYLNTISYYVNIWKNENNQRKCTVKSFVKCQRVISIYDNESLFTNKINNFDEYFKLNDIKNYTKEIINCNSDENALRDIVTNLINAQLKSNMNDKDLLILIERTH